VQGNDQANDFVRKGLKISHLRLLASFLKTGHLSQTSQMLNTSQPAASRLLVEIEHIIGHTIRHKVGRGMVLTPIGVALAERATRALLELSDAQRDIADLARSNYGMVRIGAVTGAAMDLVLPALDRVRESAPDVRVEVIIATSDVLCGHVQSGRIDFALGRAVGNLDTKQLTTQMIAPEPVTLVGRKSHPLLSLAFVTPQDLLLYDWVMPGPDGMLWAAVISRLQAIKLGDPPHRVSTKSFLLTLALLSRSNAIAPVAQAVADTFTCGENPQYCVIPNTLGIEIEPYGLIRRAGGKLSPPAEKLRAVIWDLAQLRAQDKTLF
jgi:DNA-binding transcriptional LysR family regulator